MKFAKALGAHVVMITTTPEKGADAKRLGADEVLVSRDAAQMKAHAGSFDFLLNTIPVGHDTTRTWACSSARPPCAWSAC